MNKYSEKFTEYQMKTKEELFQMIEEYQSEFEAVKAERLEWYQKYQSSPNPDVHEKLLAEIEAVKEERDALDILERRKTRDLDRQADAIGRLQAENEQLKKMLADSKDGAVLTSYFLSMGRLTQANEAQDKVLTILRRALADFPESHFVTLRKALTAADKLESESGE